MRAIDYYKCKLVNYISQNTKKNDPTSNLLARPATKSYKHHADIEMTMRLNPEAAK